jgi:Fe-S-cluster-containing dehydrogenase component/anaerobic selenocysteine-containing dehydrogenase
MFDAVALARFAGNKRPGTALEAAGFLEEKLAERKKSDYEISRRDFLKLSAATAAFATAGCALRPTEKVIPYVKAPEEIVPGVADYYASTLDDGSGTGVLVKTREGRPIKLEGNPDHPLSQGKLTAAMQAALFDLYDPDRLKAPVALTPGTRTAPAKIPWQTADQEIGKALAAAGGRIALLTGTLHGPARMKLIEEFLAAFPGARHVMADAWGHEGVRSAQEKCYGTKILPRYRFDKAEYVVSLGSDFLASGYSALEWSVNFGKMRKVRDGKISRFVAFEPMMTMTGANADERYRVHSRNMLRIALGLIHAIGDKGKLPPGSLNVLVAAHTPETVEKEAGLPAGTIKRIAQELLDHSGEGLVIAGEGESLQIVANYLNSLCDNEGKTVDGTLSPSNQSQGGPEDLMRLIADMQAGKIDVLIVWGTNPEFWLPAGAGLGDALSKVKTIVSLADRIDETATHAHYVLPGLHFLENWGDAEPQKGLYSLTQPAIYPLWENRSAEDSLIQFAKTGAHTGLAAYAADWHQYLMDTWNEKFFKSGRYLGTFENFWNSALRNGVLDTRPAGEPEVRAFMPGALAEIKVPRSETDDLELMVYPSPIHLDGKAGNNAWKFECPDPVTKIAWTNYASLSPAAASKLGLIEGDIVRLESGGINVELPAHIQPGDADGIVSVQSGWGRTHSGEVGNGTGANAFVFRRIEDGRLTARGMSCTLTATGKREKHMPNVQMQSTTLGRPVVYEARLEDYQKDPGKGHAPRKKPPTLWPPQTYGSFRWGMRIDLTSCIGCSACVIACQVENNVPVVGRTQVSMRREMHWIRVDRYYSGDMNQPDVTFQPMLCQQCENAPCETVCPVIATMHNDDGLNIQVYNRCIGTRYCSNNCPYKVRRFNWFEFSLDLFKNQPLRLGLNPDVTVREKGVMEKCDFCDQRIREAKFKAKDLGREVLDSDLQTACQQTCPTNAIMFGNFHNPSNEIVPEMDDPRSYHVLEELATWPSIVYWTKLRNREQAVTEIEQKEEHSA